MGEGDVRFRFGVAGLLAQGCWGWGVAVVGQAGPSLHRRCLCGAARGGGWGSGTSHAGVLCRSLHLQPIQGRAALKQAGVEAPVQISDKGPEGLPRTLDQGH